MSRAKPSNVTHSVVMNGETYNVLQVNGKFKYGKYKGYNIEISSSVPTGKFRIIDNIYLEKIERGEHEQPN